jgi:hypothetical protein
MGDAQTQQQLLILAAEYTMRAMALESEESISAARLEGRVLSVFKSVSKFKFRGVLVSISVPCPFAILVRLMLAASFIAGQSRFGVGMAKGASIGPPADGLEFYPRRNPAPAPPSAAGSIS